MYALYLRDAHASSSTLTPSFFALLCCLPLSLQGTVGLDQLIGIIRLFDRSLTMHHGNNEKTVRIVRDSSVHIVPRQERRHDAGRASTPCQGFVWHAFSRVLCIHIGDPKEKESNPDREEEQVKHDGRPQSKHPHLETH